MMIGRVWHGWTTHANAEAFEAYIRNEEWPAIFARNIKGLREIECLRLVRPGHTEFKTVMRFELAGRRAGVRGRRLHQGGPAAARTRIAPPL